MLAVPPWVNQTKPCQRTNKTVHDANTCLQYKPFRQTFTKYKSQRSQDSKGAQGASQARRTTRKQADAVTYRGQRLGGPQSAHSGRLGDQPARLVDGAITASTVLLDEREPCLNLNRRKVQSPENVSKACLGTSLGPGAQSLKNPTYVAGERGSVKMTEFDDARHDADPHRNVCVVEGHISVPELEA